MRRVEIEHGAAGAEVGRGARGTDGGPILGVEVAAHRGPFTLREGARIDQHLRHVDLGAGARLPVSTLPGTPPMPPQLRGRAPSDTLSVWSGPGREDIRLDAVGKDQGIEDGGARLHGDEAPLIEHVDPCEVAARVVAEPTEDVEGIRGVLVGNAGVQDFDAPGHPGGRLITAQDDR